MTQSPAALPNRCANLSHANPAGDNPIGDNPSGDNPIRLVLNQSAPTQRESEPPAQTWGPTAHRQPTSASTALVARSYRTRRAACSLCAEHRAEPPASIIY